MTDQVQTSPNSQIAQPGTNSEPKNPKQKLAMILAQVNKPKILTIIVLLFTIIVIILALNLISKKEPPPEFIPEVVKIIPTPEPSLDPSKENIGKLVNKYNEKLNGLPKPQRELVYPIVNLEISFE